MRLDFARAGAGRPPGRSSGSTRGSGWSLTVAYVVAVVLTPPGAWRGWRREGLLLAFVVGWAGVEPGSLARRWLGFAPLVGFLALMIAPGHPAGRNSGSRAWRRRSWPRTAWRSGR